MEESESDDGMDCVMAYNELLCRGCNNWIKCSKAIEGEKIGKEIGL